MTTVYRCQPGWPATQIILLLKQNGLSPMEVGQGLAENMVVMGGSGVTVEIAVPDEQAPTAANLVQRFENARAIAVARTARELRAHFLIAGITGMLVAVTVNLLAFRLAAIKFTVVLGEAALVAMVLMYFLGRRSKRTADYGEFGPRCPACEYLLIGLPEPRCPECGLEFDANFFDSLPEPPRT